MISPDRPVLIGPVQVRIAMIIPDILIDYFDCPVEGPGNIRPIPYILEDLLEDRGDDWISWGARPGNRILLELPGEEV